MGEEKARPGDNRIRACGQGPADVGRVGDPARDQDRPSCAELEDARKRAQRGLGSHQVAARLESLHHEPVGAFGERPLRLRPVSDGVEHQRAAAPKPLDQRAAKARVKDDHLRARARARLNVLPCRERDQQIGRDRRSAGALAGTPELEGEGLGRHDPDRPERARRGHFARKRGCRDPTAHASLDDGVSQAQLIDQGHGPRL